MRKIEREMIEAIKTKKPYNNDNTEVSIREGILRVYLHGHLIAQIEESELFLTDCGYKTKTTKSRLNCLLSHFGFPVLYSKNYQWYIGDDMWQGNKIFQIVDREAELIEYFKDSAVLGGKH
jgi:hypothetical protein